MQGMLTLYKVALFKVTSDKFIASNFVVLDDLLDLFVTSGGVGALKTVSLPVSPMPPLPQPVVCIRFPYLNENGFNP